MALFWLPTQRFLSCRLKVAESALLVVDSDSFWLPTQPFFGCRLIVADSDLLVADSDRNLAVRVCHVRVCHVRFCNVGYEMQVHVM